MGELRYFGFVYFIRPVGMPGPIKIGWSSTPRLRLAAIEPWSPFLLEIVAKVPGNIGHENSIHSKFAHLHSHQEWFRWAPELEAMIAEINAGEFDVESLPRGRRAGRSGARKPLAVI